MMNYIHARGAYGRPAKLEDWQAGKDFQDIETCQYFSCRDIKALKGMLFIGVMFYDMGKPVFKVDF